VHVSDRSILEGLFLEYVYLLGEWQNISLLGELYNTEGEDHIVQLWATRVIPHIIARDYQYYRGISWIQNFPRRKR